MKTVLILLSTYNGETFLGEQLDSLYAQDGISLHILVRDDGSRDGTVKILQKYKDKYGRMTILSQHNIGCIHSFFTLMQVASIDYRDFDYYAFCDQDDIWLPNKLSHAIQTLEKSYNERKMYFSGFTLIDTIGNVKGKSNKQKGVGYKGALITNAALGCTMVFTPNVLHGAIKIKTKQIPIEIMSILPLHDVWMYMYSSYADVDIIYDSEFYEGIYYRQHGHNVTQYKKNIFTRGKLFLRNLHNFRNYRYKRAVLLEYIAEDFSSDKLQYLKILTEYKKGISETIKCFIKLDISSRPFWERIIFRLFILFRNL